MPLPRAVLVKTTLVDYPGRVAASVFLPGCNLRCPYCHNPELVTGPIPEEAVPVDFILSFLSRRKAVLGGVCISGGEPLLHPEIGTFVAAVRDMGLAVKLDTNGTFPDRLSELPLDFIAMDVKTSPLRYAAVMGNDPGETAGEIARKVRESAAYIIRSGIPHEFRTTAAPGIVGEEDLPSIAELVAGADSYVLAEFRDCRTLDPDFPRGPAFSRDDLQRMAGMLEREGITVKVRLSRS